MIKEGEKQNFYFFTVFMQLTILYFYRITRVHLLVTIRAGVLVCYLCVHYLILDIQKRVS